jgi:hypothetical protein
MPVSVNLMAALLAAAAQFSGLPPIDVSDLPPVETVSNDQFSKMVCPFKPSRCRAMIAAFDTQRYRIVIRESLDLNDPGDNSFLVHEIVHVLQYKKDGSTRFMSCEGVIASEQEAFDAQNLYMKSFGLLRQEGTALRFMRCPPEGTTVSDTTPGS